MNAGKHDIELITEGSGRAYRCIHSDQLAVHPVDSVRSGQVMTDAASKPAIKHAWGTRQRSGRC